MARVLVTGMSGMGTLSVRPSTTLSAPVDGPGGIRRLLGVPYAAGSA